MAQESRSVRRTGGSASNSRASLRGGGRRGPLHQVSFTLLQNQVYVKLFVFKSERRKVATASVGFPCGLHLSWQGEYKSLGKS